VRAKLIKAEESNKKLVLIDGNAIIHRAYHSMPKTLTTRKGEATNAVYGFAITLIKVLEDLRPQYLAATFDLPGPTFRHEIYKEYKATRVKADQDLYDQIPRVKQLVSAFGIPIYEKEGFEADDCLGTIVKKLSAASFQLSGNSKNNNSQKPTANSQQLTAYIVSGDKDIFQLINGDVKVYNLKKGLSQTQIVDAEVIQNEYNLQPSDFIDLKALAGDPSDNIPGVPGIGPKTATELIQRYDTLQHLYEVIAAELENASIISKSEFLISKQIQNVENSEIQKFIGNCKAKLATASGGVPQNAGKIENYAGEIEAIAKSLQIKTRILHLLITYYPQALLSQHLATIKLDVPIDFSLEDCKWGEYDKDKLKELFEELGFQSLLRRFGASITEKQNNQETEEQRTVISNKDEQLKLL
jgi:DNA polymerase-1